MGTAQVSTESVIRRVVAVMSAKGGTGKSLVTALLAVALSRSGLRVGVLDADLNASSIAHMFGMRDVRVEVGASEPPCSKSGIKIISMSMLVGHEPVVWRESMLAGAFRQLYRDVQWGELDYLLVDAPGGTSDVSMAILESLPLTGVIVVASPQRVANIAVKKCISMVQQYKQPVLGIVENMSYYVAPSGVRCELFGPSSSEALATLAGAPVLAHLPIERELATLCNAGRIEECRVEVYEAFIARFLQQKAIAGEKERRGY